MGIGTLDEKVMLNGEAESDSEDTFTQGAMRTGGLRMSDQERAARYAEYCLGDPVPLLEVVEKVTAEFRSRKEIDDNIHARAVVYDVLCKNYRCNNSNELQR